MSAPVDRSTQRLQHRSRKAHPLIAQIAIWAINALIVREGKRGVDMRVNVTYSRAEENT